MATEIVKLEEDDSFDDEVESLTHIFEGNTLEDLIKGPYFLMSSFPERIEFTIKLLALFLQYHKDKDGRAHGHITPAMVRLTPTENGGAELAIIDAAKLSKNESADKRYSHYNDPFLRASKSIMKPEPDTASDLYAIGCMMLELWGVELTQPMTELSKTLNSMSEKQGLAFAKKQREHSNLRRLPVPVIQAAASLLKPKRDQRLLSFAIVSLDKARSKTCKEQDELKNKILPELITAIASRLASVKVDGRYLTNSSGVRDMIELNPKLSNEEKLYRYIEIANERRSARKGFNATFFWRRHPEVETFYRLLSRFDEHNIESIKTLDHFTKTSTFFPANTLIQPNVGVIPVPK